LKFEQTIDKQGFVKSDGGNIENREPQQCLKSSLRREAFFGPPALEIDPALTADWLITFLRPEIPNHAFVKAAESGFPREESD